MTGQEMAQFLQQLGNRQVIDPFDQAAYERIMAPHPAHAVFKAMERLRCIQQYITPQDLQASLPPPPIPPTTVPALPPAPNHQPAPVLPRGASAGKAREILQQLKGNR